MHDVEWVKNQIYPAPKIQLNRIESKYNLNVFTNVYHVIIEWQKTVAHLRLLNV